MRNKYEGRDIDARLGGTIIRFRKKAYQAFSDGGNNVALKSLTTGKTVHVVAGTDPDLDVSSVPLGYINDHRSQLACFILREPARRFKQGVDPTVVRITPLSKKPGDFRYDGQQVLCSSGFVEHMEGQYPTLEAAIALITKQGRESVAISSEVALLKNKDIIEVYIEQDEVGFISLKNPSHTCTISDSNTSWVYRSILGKVGITVKEGAGQ